MNKVDNNSVHLVVTSPPYWNIKDYQHEDQIGYDQTIEEYVADMQKVLSECYKKLIDGGKMAINIGDVYCTGGVIPLHVYIVDIIQKLGMDYHGSIIWNKISNTTTSGGGAWMGSTYYPRDGRVTLEHEYIVVARKKGIAPRPSEEAKEKSRMTKEERSSWFRGIWSDVAPSRQKEHPATFPLELPLRLIKMFSFYGETVLDPFLGTGITSKACEVAGRNSVGYELNHAYMPLIYSNVSSLTANIEFKYNT